MPILAFVNAAKNLTNEQADFIVAALRLQSHTFHKFWPDVEPIPAFLFPNEAAFSVNGIQENVFPAVFVDDPDIAGVQGYHSVDKGGRYYVKIFVDLLLRSGAWNDAVSSCASHEYLETVLNPTCAIRARGPQRPEGDLYQKEASDPVEADKYETTVERYQKTEKVALSNFVLPSYFDLNTPKGERVDFLGTCPGPFQLAPGGYMLVANDLQRPTPVWGKQVPLAPEAQQYKAHGRRWRGGVE